MDNEHDEPQEFPDEELEAIADNDAQLDALWSDE